MSEKELDMVNHPQHYETGCFECIDVMLETQGEEAVKDFCICNAFKYLYRQRSKNGIEDIKKAVWYLNKYIDIVESPHFTTGDDIPGQMEFHINDTDIWWLDDNGRLVRCDKATSETKDCIETEPVVQGISGEYGGLSYL